MSWWITDGIYKDKKESGKLCKIGFKLNPSFDKAQQILQLKNLRYHLPKQQGPELVDLICVVWHLIWQLVLLIPQALHGVRILAASPQSCTAAGVQKCDVLQNRRLLERALNSQQPQHHQKVQATQVSGIFTSE